MFASPVLTWYLLVVPVRLVATRHLAALLGLERVPVLDDFKDLLYLGTGMPAFESSCS